MSRQTVPAGDEVGASRLATAYLDALLAVAGLCADGNATADALCDAVVQRLVERCGDVDGAAVYLVAEDHRHAALRAEQRRSPGAERWPPAVALTDDGDFPTEDPPAATTTALASPADATRLGWLRVAFAEPGTSARGLFLQAAAQQLSAALVRREARDDTRARAQALAQREETVSSFLGAIGERIRTPLTLLLGPLESATHRVDDPALASALRHGQRLKRLCDTLIDFSHIDPGRVEPELRAMDVAAATRRLASMFHGAAAAAGIALTIDCPPLPEPVYLDAGQWEQVVIQLLSDLFVRNTSGTIHVVLRAQVGLMTLEMSDLTSGPTVAESPSPIDRFRWARDREDGGLGVALVREFVQLHGGDIEAVGLAGRGSRFRVCVPMLGKPAWTGLPRAEPRAPTQAWRSMRSAVLDRRPAGPRVVPVEEATLSGEAPRPCIVVAVDHAELRDYVTSLLHAHYRVEASSDALDALQAVRRGDPDLVIVDLAGDPIDSHGFMQRFRETTRGVLVPAVLLSSDTRAVAHARAMEAGADDVIVKPFVAAELLARVGAHVRLSRERRAIHRGIADLNHDLETLVAQRTAALSASEAQFRAISNLVPDILWRIDATGHMEWRSEQWQRYTGATGLDQGLDVVHPDDRLATRAWLEATLAGQPRGPHEYRLRRHDGVYRWFIARMSPWRNAEGRIERWFGSTTDIELHQLARHALEAQVDERSTALARAAAVQQELLHRLSRSEEDERRRIARELHDSLGQYLAALRLALDALAPALSESPLRGRVEHLADITTAVDRELDEIIAALRPVVLDELGLAGALPAIVASWSRQSGVEGQVSVLQLNDERFDEESESALYRITQESLTNVVKHARARNVAVTLTRRSGELQLTIEDDGIGFDANSAGGGWGLRGMAERARSVGGLLQVESSAGSGTTVLVRVPCRPSVGQRGAAAGSA